MTLTEAINQFNNDLLTEGICNRTKEILSLLPNRDHKMFLNICEIIVKNRALLVCS